MNDLILADRELEVGFIGKLDALFEGIERMDASHKASPSNERFLTDREVSARRTAESEPTHLAGLPQQRHNRLLPVGRQDSIQGIGHRTDACRQLPGSVQTASIIVNKRNTTGRHQVVFLTLSSRISFVSTTWGFSCTCRQRKEQI